MKRQECGAKRGKPIWNPIGNLMALHENNSGMDPLRTTGQDFRLRTNPTGSGSDVAEPAVPHDKILGYGQIPQGPGQMLRNSQYLLYLWSSWVLNDTKPTVPVLKET